MRNSLKPIREETLFSKFKNGLRGVFDFTVNMLQMNLDP